jgi:hypothetical protein
MAAPEAYREKRNQTKKHLAERRGKATCRPSSSEKEFRTVQVF